MREKKQLSKAEMQVMSVLWGMDASGVTSAEVMERYDEPRPAMTTLLTFLKRLTEKGFVQTEKQGKLLRFTPLVGRDEYTAQYMADAKDTLFGGSPTSLLTFFVQHEQLDDDQLNELLDIIKQKRRL